MERTFTIALVLFTAILLQQQLVVGKGGGAGKGAGHTVKNTAKTTTSHVTKTTSTSKSQDKNSSTASKEEQQQALDMFNKKRAEKPGSSPLTLDDKLNKDAQKCADYYADKQNVDHTCPHKGGAKENAYGTKDKFDMSMLMNDAKDFDYSKPNFVQDNPAFAFMPWPGSTDSKKMGFGKASKKGFTAACCLFSQ